MIYFDNSATTKALPAVLDTYRKVSEDFFLATRQACMHSAITPISC